MDRRTKQDLLEELVHLENLYQRLREERNCYFYLLDEIAHDWPLSVLDRLQNHIQPYYAISSYNDGEILKKLVDICNKRI